MALVQDGVNHLVVILGLERVLKISAGRLHHVALVAARLARHDVKALQDFHQRDAAIYFNTYELVKAGSVKSHKLRTLTPALQHARLGEHKELLVRHVGTLVNNLAGSHNLYAR